MHIQYTLTAGMERPDSIEVVTVIIRLMGGGSRELVGKRKGARAGFVQPAVTARCCLERSVSELVFSELVSAVASMAPASSHVPVSLASGVPSWCASLGRLDARGNFTTLFWRAFV